MANVTGTTLDDVMTPTVGQFTRPDGTVVARPENKTTAQADTVFGRDGDDSINGGRGDDSIEGGRDNDTLIGHLGNDFINGGRDNDHIDGGDGGDYMFG